jgi:branched-chain amino acid transport system permease protein
MIGAVTLVAIPDIVDTVVHRLESSDVVANNLPGFLVSALLILTVLFVPNGPVEQMRAKHEKRAMKKKT